MVAAVTDDVVVVLEHAVGELARIIHEERGERLNSLISQQELQRRNFSEYFATKSPIQP